VAHAILGCAVAAGRAGAGGGDAATGCSSGAIGAVVGNLAAEFYDPNRQRDSASVSAFSQTMAGIAGALVGGDAAGAYIAALAGGNAVENNRQLHYNERESIKIEAAGDEARRTRLTRAACYVVQCWAQYPEGSYLYNLNYVGYMEASALTEETAWVQDRQRQGLFNYSTVERVTDGIAATFGMSSGTYNGNLITDRGSYALGAAGLIAAGPILLTGPGQSVLLSNGAAGIAGGVFNTAGQLFANGGDVKQLNFGEIGIATLTGSAGGAAQAFTVGRYGAGFGYGLGGTGTGGLSGLGWLRPSIQSAKGSSPWLEALRAGLQCLAVR
jgi:hypothetical protein